MGWMGPVVGDVQHEGWVVPVFADGAEGAGTSGSRGILVARKAGEGPRNGDRVQLGYPDGSTVVGVWQDDALVLDDGLVYSHVRGQVRREVLEEAEDWRPDAAVVGYVAGCDCGWRGRPWTRVTSPELATWDVEVSWDGESHTAERPMPFPAAQAWCAQKVAELFRDGHPEDASQAAALAHRIEELTGESRDYALTDENLAVEVRISARGAGAQTVDPAARLLANPGPYYDLDDAAERVVIDEWHGHIAPFMAMERLEEAVAKRAAAAREVDEAALAARAAGASWNEIGRATGMTRQSANERWAARL